jgi:hypothetical protein
MAELEGLTRKYLYSVLADGSRNFRYRSRVRSLLGLPKTEGIKVSFGTPHSDMMSFTYSRSPSTGDFYAPEETQDNPSHDWTSTEDFINLSTLHQSLNLQKSLPGHEAAARTSYVSENVTEQPLEAKAMRVGNAALNHQPAQSKPAIQEQKQAETSDPIEPLSKASLANVISEPMRERRLEILKIPQYLQIEDSNLRKAQAPRVAEVQTLSPPRNSQPVQVDTSYPITQTPVQPSMNHVSPRLVSSNSKPDLSRLPHIKPQTKGMEEQASITQPFQLPTLKTRAGDGVPNAKPTLPSLEVEAESKPIHAAQSPMPTPGQPAKAMWRGIEPRPRPRAYWERRHLRRYRLRLLR